MLSFKLRRLFYKPLIVAATALTTSISATADDLDVFQAMLDSQSVPNILFVLDYSGSMNQDIYGNKITDETTLSKFDILESAVSNVMKNNKGAVNVGLGSTYSYRSSGVRWPISDLEANANDFDPDIPLTNKAGDNITVADVIEAQINRKEPKSSTATVNALAEAAAYFRGDDVLHSDSPISDIETHKPDQWDISAEQYNGGNEFSAIPASYSPNKGYDFANDTWTTPQYISPLTKRCQANFIVLISDGQPTNRRDTQTLNTVLNAAGVADVSGCDDLSSTIFDEYVNDPTITHDDDDDVTGNCGPEILEYLANTNLNQNINGSNVNSFIIGFGIDGDGKDYLELLAQKGKGDFEDNNFYDASSPAELTSALESFLLGILPASQNFVELSIDVNASTFSHGDRAYFSLFSPSAKSTWDGNLKGYFVDDAGLNDITGEKATVETTTGIRFSDKAQSFWSSTQDGNDVMVGGASETITDLPDGPNSRNIYTYLGGANKILPSTDENSLSSDNTAIDNATMGTASDADRISALDWIANAPMGDPLHTKPVVVSYEDASGKYDIAYIMTNQGLIHAFDVTKPLVPNKDTPDATGAAELFAFMPEELLSNLPKLQNPTEGADHVYGLDGPITRWHNDENKDGMVNGNEKVQLIFGMRRGGYSYYSLNVTKPKEPAFNWQISKGDFGFENLAQTWSRPSLVSVQDDSNGKPIDDNAPIETKRVLMFGGGYDAATVDNTLVPIEASGNAIYIVGENGNLLKTIEHGEMEYSIPSDLTIIDSDRNGAADRIYFGDLGGNMWRVDFTDITTAPISVNKFADVKDFGGHQPIFYAPSVSITKENGIRHMAIAFGTGDRTQPMLDDSENAFFMLRDEDYEVGPPDSKATTITRSNIYNATNNDIDSSDESTRNRAKAELYEDNAGWLVYLNPGEKALSKVVTYDGKFLATTFEPNQALDDNGDPDPCAFDMFGRLYVMSLSDARPVKLLDDGTETNKGLDKMTRITNLNSSTIPSKPVITFPADSSKAQIFVDKESVVSVNKPISTVFWHAK